MQCGVQHTNYEDIPMTTVVPIRTTFISLLTHHFYHSLTLLSDKNILIKICWHFSEPSLFFKYIFSNLQISPDLTCNFHSHTLLSVLGEQKGNGFIKKKNQPKHHSKLIYRMIVLHTFFTCILQLSEKCTSVV